VCRTLLHAHEGDISGYSHFSGTNTLFKRVASICFCYSLANSLHASSNHLLQRLRRSDRELGNIRHILSPLYQFHYFSNSDRFSFVSKGESTEHFVIFESFNTDWGRCFNEGLNHHSRLGKLRGFLGLATRFSLKVV